MRRSMDQLRHDLKTLEDFPQLSSLVKGGLPADWVGIRQELTRMSEELSDFRMLAEEEFGVYPEEAEEFKGT